MNKNLSKSQFSKYQMKFTPGVDTESEIGYNRVDALHKGKLIGFLDWHPDLHEGELQHIEVAPEHRRKGVATAMWNFAKNQEDAPTHSPDRTDAGESRAKSTNEPLPKRRKI